jgi:hypothetical protein
MELSLCGGPAHNFDTLLRCGLHGTAIAPSSSPALRHRLRCRASRSFLANTCGTTLVLSSQMFALIAAVDCSAAWIDSVESGVGTGISGVMRGPLMPMVSNDRTSEALASAGSLV